MTKAKKNRLRSIREQCRNYVNTIIAEFVDFYLVNAINEDGKYMHDEETYRRARSAAYEMLDEAFTKTLNELANAR